MTRFSHVLVILEHPRKRKNLLHKVSISYISCNEGFHTCDSRLPLFSLLQTYIYYGLYFTLHIKCLPVILLFKPKPSQSDLRFNDPLPTVVIQIHSPGASWHFDLPRHDRRLCFPHRLSIQEWTTTTILVDAVRLSPIGYPPALLGDRE